LTHLLCLCPAAQSDVFAGEYGAKRLADLKLRVIEHNVLVVSKYYTRITTARLAELLDLKPLEVRGGVCCAQLAKACWFACQARPCLQHQLAWVDGTA
jgi:hypothetical protein